MIRMRMALHGVVQGVGFRPFVYRLARSLHLKGWVNNSPQGVLIEIEGERAVLDEFVLRLGEDKPEKAFINSLEAWILDLLGYEDFVIRPSTESGPKTSLIMPDSATCPDCLAEIFDPADRRYFYPFTNCTNCGPRYTIIDALPYDRAATSMKQFIMCEACQAEYSDPENRRFHAQPNACPECGPHLEFWNEKGEVICERQGALLMAADYLKRGCIGAIKGLGGFHFMFDALDEPAIARMRQLKQRQEKPFALMFPAVAMIEHCCEVSALERRLLQSAEAPIVLLRQKAAPAHLVSPLVAPGNPWLGIMLPYTPLHHLLLTEIGRPVVATSGNMSEETICMDETAAVKRFGSYVDFFLVHNRPIVRHCDDSIVRLCLGRELLLRRARGYAPLPVILSQTGPPVLATGAHQKITLAVSRDAAVFISQHIGDLETEDSLSAFHRTRESLLRLYDVKPEIIVTDKHPDYYSTRWASRSGFQHVQVQHHYAHVLSCMAENEGVMPALGVAWDGTGFGDDGSIWGGEFLLLQDNSYQRVGHLRQFHLPGGDMAVREPRRSAFGLLYSIMGKTLTDLVNLPLLQEWSKRDIQFLIGMIDKGINSPLTSSAGRLFDAIAALIGLQMINTYEGQGAMQLEFAADRFLTEDHYSFELEEKAGFTIVDWEKMVYEILDEIENRKPIAAIAARFHNTLSASIAAMARKFQIQHVYLSGGCFQNKYLLERTMIELQEAGFKAYCHQRIPPNDGGLSLGQVYAAHILRR